MQFKSQASSCALDPSPAFRFWDSELKSCRVTGWWQGQKPKYREQGNKQKTWGRVTSSNWGNAETVSKLKQRSKEKANREKVFVRGKSNRSRGKIYQSQHNGQTQKERATDPVLSWKLSTHVTSQTPCLLLAAQRCSVPEILRGPDVQTRVLFLLLLCIFFSKYIFNNFPLLVGIWAWSNSLGNTVIVLR